MVFYQSSLPLLHVDPCIGRALDGVMLCWVNVHTNVMSQLLERKGEH